MEQVSKQQKIRVASYNIRKCVGLDRKRAPERVLGVISALNSDIVILQEADKRLRDRPAALPHRLIEKDSDFKPVDLAENEASLGWHGNAILLNRDTQLKNHDRIDLPGMEPRGAVLAEVRHKGRDIRVVGTHLGLLRRHRHAQLTELCNNLAGREPMPTMILGDFNEWRETKGLEPLLDGFTLLAPGRSYHAARPVAALDRIASSDDLAVTDAGVVDHGSALRASDHLPVWADFSYASCD